MVNNEQVKKKSDKEITLRERIEDYAAAVKSNREFLISLSAIDLDIKIKEIFSESEPTEQ
jgi:hypothetical protein